MIDRRLALLLAAAIGLGGYTLWSGDSALSTWLTSQDDIVTAVKQPPATSIAQTKANKETNLNPLATLRIEQFEDIVQRPLFNATRAPAPVPEQVVDEEPEQQAVVEVPVVEEPPVKPEDFALLGIASKGGTWTVVMRWNPSNEVHRLKTGGEIQGWSLTEVTPQGVKLSRNGKDLDIKMFQHLGPAPGMTIQPADSPDVDEQGQPMNPQLINPQLQRQQSMNPAQMPPQRANLDSDSDE